MDQIITQLEQDLRSNEITSELQYHDVFMQFLGKPGATAQKEYGEVYTPLTLVSEILDLLPPRLWKDKALKWFEPACGLAPFLYLVYHRLMTGLAEEILNEKTRRKHILEKMLYFNEIQPKNLALIRLLFNATDYQLNIFEGDCLSLPASDFHPDVCLMNPPYNGVRGTVLYNKFVERYISSPVLVAITPSRWFIGGKGLDGYRRLILSRDDVVVIKHQPDTGKWFPTAKIEGGVNYLIKDSSHKGSCLFNGVEYDLGKYPYLYLPEYHSLIKKVEKFPSITDIYQGRCYGIETNDPRLKSEGKVECFVGHAKEKSRIQYLTEYVIPEDKRNWKVVVARANGDKPCFGFMTVGRPDQVHTGTYISFKVKSKEEAESLLSYLKTPIANKLLAISKNSQNMSEKTMSLIPLIPLDRDWDEMSVMKYLGLNGEKRLCQGTLLSGKACKCRVGFGENYCLSHLD